MIEFICAAALVVAVVLLIRRSRRKKGGFIRGEAFYLARKKARRRWR